uniref:Protein kinase domain-containing protein n=1 Tax=Trieres chinensis TaxID=1514140 RepID=A0A7S2E889_TRICV|mmetsp:Transcript_12061/g.25145  ORF Transcript_12061/g.25145 Transcript_12061/m.25145 type:complete len:439 (+) Transcript_12061:105-1421(+)
MTAPTTTISEAANSANGASDKAGSLAKSAQPLQTIDLARIKVKKYFERTHLGVGEKEHLFPRFHYSELHIGAWLGKGGFGTVSEISKITVQKDKCTSHASFSFRTWAVTAGMSSSTHSHRNIAVRPIEEDSEEEEELYVPEEDPDFDESAFQSKKFIADYCVGKGGHGRYAIKCISDSVKENPKMFVQAAMDMAVETQFLSVFDHPNIIKLRAVGQGDMFDKDYFLVMDRLFDTLCERIERWTFDIKQSKLCMAKFFGGKKTRKTIFANRLGVAKDLAGAMEYLHGLNIIYRDMKPENIGFDVKDVVKLFDFGLAKELHPEDRFSNGNYKLTGNTGSIRYMAPEVATKRPYNLSADVYSFGIMLWEITSLKIPFDGYNEFMMKETVANFGYRLDIDESWPEDLKKLIRKSWEAAPKKRPSFSEIITSLEEISSSLTDD